MNKKLIALAVAAGMAAPMAAQAGDPTLYGKLQAELFSTSSDFAAGAPATDGHVVNPGGSRLSSDGVGIDDSKRGRLGVKGSRDFGGGLTGIYKFEWQVDTADGDVADGTRDSWVGLKGGFGTFQIGSVKAPYKYFGGVKYDPFVTTKAEARRYGGMTQGRMGSNGFWNRSLSYQFKTGGGGHFWAVYSPSEAESNDGGTAGEIDDGDYSVGFKQKMGNWEAFAVAAHDEDNSTAGNGYDALKIGGAMSFGPSKVMAQIENTTDETAGGDNDGQVVWVNYNLKMGKNTFTAAYGMGEVDFAGSTTDQENDMIRVGLIHKFSKKSRFFLAYATRTYDNLNGSTASSNTGDLDVITGGIRHDF